MFKKSILFKESNKNYRHNNNQKGAIIIQDNKKIKILLALILPLFFFNNVYAEDNQATYFVKPVIAENQRKDVTDYFDIQLMPKKQQELNLQIFNNTDEAITFSTMMENAITNDHGVIEYQHKEKEYDESLKYKLTDLAKVEKTIVVEGNSVGNVEMTITMPDEEFDGIILGGIRVSEETEDSQKQSGISNIFSYVIPIKLWQNDIAIPNKLNFNGITIGQKNVQNAIKAKLQNPQPSILRDLSLEAKIYKKKDDSIYSETQEVMKLAPNSSFNYSISLGDKKITAGEYRLELTATAENFNETWKEDFEITGSVAKALNDEIVFKKKINKETYILVIAFVLSILTIGYLLYRQKKLKIEYTKSLETKKIRKRKQKTKLKKILIFLVTVTSLGLSNKISIAAETNNGVSDATILIKPKEVEKEPASSIENSKKGTIQKLPQTDETQGKQLISLGNGILLCAAIIFIKRERGKKNEK